MAKATISLADRISLSDALRQVQMAVGSRRLAEIKLRRWFATGELPWDCTTWGGRRKLAGNDGKGPLVLDDSVSKGDPLFFCGALVVNWDDSSASEATIPFGAKALGIYTSRARLFELLEGPLVRKLPGKQWVLEAYKRRPDALLAMGITGASEALARKSKTAPDCLKSPLTAGYIKNLLRENGAFPKAYRGRK